MSHCVQLNASETARPIFLPLGLILTVGLLLLPVLTIGCLIFISQKTGHKWEIFYMAKQPFYKKLSKPTSSVPIMAHVSTKVFRHFASRRVASPAGRVGKFWSLALLKISYLKLSCNNESALYFLSTSELSS